MGKQTEDIEKGAKSAEREKLDEQALLQRTADRMKIFNDAADKPRREPPEADDLEDDDDLDEELDLEDDDDAQSEEDDDDSSEALPTPDAEDDHEDEDEDESGNVDDADDGEVKMPHAYVQTAKAYGWTDKDIARLVKADPKGAMRTFQNIYTARNDINTHYSNLGRKARELTPDNKDQATPVLKKVDRDKLVEQYGEESAPLIDMIQGQNDVINQMNEQVSRLVKPDTGLIPDITTKYNSVVEESGVDQQIEMFFESDAMKPYNKIYGNVAMGTTFDDLPAGQRQHRWKVLDHANLIVAGAKSQGIKMTLSEALESAHLLVTEKYREQILVEGIKTKMKKRSNGRTLRPAKGAKKADNSVNPKTGKRTEQQLLSDTRNKLDKIFNN